MKLEAYCLLNNSEIKIFEDFVNGDTAISIDIKQDSNTMKYYNDDNILLFFNFIKIYIVDIFHNLPTKAIVNTIRELHSNNYNVYKNTNSCNILTTVEFSNANNKFPFIFAHNCLRPIEISNNYRTFYRFSSIIEIIKKFYLKKDNNYQNIIEEQKIFINTKLSNIKKLLKK